MKVLESHHKPAAKRVKVKATNKLKGEETSESLIPKEYCDFSEVFSKEESNVLPPYCSTDCAIEIMPKTKVVVDDAQGIRETPSICG